LIPSLLSFAKYIFLSFSLSLFCRVEQISFIS
jgi:hypothetical protein